MLYALQAPAESQTLRLMSSLPARPKGPPPVSVAARKWWGRWFFVVLAIAVAGGLTRRRA